MTCGAVILPAAGRANVTLVTSRGLASSSDGGHGDTAGRSTRGRSVHSPGWPLPRVNRRARSARDARRVRAPRAASNAPAEVHAARVGSGRATRTGGAPRVLGDLAAVTDPVRARALRVPVNDGERARVANAGPTGPSRGPEDCAGPTDQRRGRVGSAVRKGRNPSREARAHGEPMSDVPVRRGQGR